MNSIKMLLALSLIAGMVDAAKIYLAISPQLQNVQPTSLKIVVDGKSYLFLPSINIDEQDFTIETANKQYKSAPLKVVDGRTYSVVDINRFGRFGRIAVDFYDDLPELPAPQQ